MERRTVFEQISLTRVRRARTMRRVGLGVLVVFLGLGAFNLFGVRTVEASARRGGYELEVHYAAMTRAGLATPWTVFVRRPGGFDGPVTLATTADYFELFDENGLDPVPTSSRTDGELIIWKFEQPPGEVLEVDFDARLSPAVQVGKRAATSVLVNDRPVVTVEYETGVMP
ncbi:MAG TPA: hypothetical protein VE754_03665 [Actinomycetota bacterium]|nr:hypothetical protein [Actinomycetota bacterium]